MADDKPSKAEAKLGTVVAPFQVPDDRRQPEEPAKPIPKKGDDAYDTPSGRAIAVVGEFKGDDPEEAREHGLRYLYEKMKLRWGIGA